MSPHVVIKNTAREGGEMILAAAYRPALLTPKLTNRQNTTSSCTMQVIGVLLGFQLGVVWTQPGKRLVNAITYTTTKDTLILQ